MDKLQMSYGYQLQIRSAHIYGKINQFHSSVPSLRTHRIRDGCHNYIRDIKDEFMDEKYDP